MAEMEERLEALCQVAALLVLQHPERSTEVELEIADAFRVQPNAVHELIRQQLLQLNKIDRTKPLQHA